MKGAIVRIELAACAWLALACLAACDSGDLGLADSANGELRPLVTLTVPAESNGDWDVSDPKVAITTHNDRPVLFFKEGDSDVAVACPTPAEARGAGSVSLRVGSDGPIEFRLEIGDRTTRTMPMGPTRRQWRELVFRFDRPLGEDEVGVPLRIVRTSSEMPVVVEAVRFLP
ncbi:MAG: hypothetical protein AAGA20_16305 [Planctomycetota bacterium]